MLFNYFLVATRPNNGAILIAKELFWFWDLYLNGQGTCGNSTHVIQTGYIIQIRNNLLFRKPRERQTPRFPSHDCHPRFILYRDLIEEATNNLESGDADLSAIPSSEFEDLARPLNILDDCNPEPEMEMALPTSAEGDWACNEEGFSIQNPGHVDLSADPSSDFAGLTRGLDLSDDRELEPEVEMVFPTLADDEWICIEDYNWDILDNYKTQLAGRPTAPSCPHGVLEKIFDIGPSSLCAAE